MPEDAPSGPPDAKSPNEAPVRKTRAHLPFLDGIRALAALYVVLHHASTNLREPASSALAPWLGYGHFAVDVFIVLSGFSLTLPVAIFGTLKGGARSFLVRRARRILPAYLFALALSALLGGTILSGRTGTVWDATLPVTGRALLAHVALVQDLFPDYEFRIDYPLWSVSIESHIYLLFPLIVLLFARYRGLTVALGAIALGYAVQLLLSRIPVFGSARGALPYYLGPFVLGCFAARLSVSRAKGLRWYPFATLVVSIAALDLCWTVWSGRFHTPPPETISSLFVALAAAASMLALGAGQWSRLRKLLSWRPLAFLGTFSYSVYLIHAPILQLVWKYLAHPLGLTGRRESFALAILATPLVILGAWLFSLAFERPFMPRSPAAERLAAP